MSYPLKHDPTLDGLTPEQALERWPADQPLAALWSGAPANAGWGWTMLARVSGVVIPAPTPGEIPLPPTMGRERTRDEHHRHAGDGPVSRHADACPLGPGWIGAIAYEAGELVEPTGHAGASGAAATPGPDHWPVAAYARTDDALVYDHARGAWLVMGAASVIAERVRGGSSRRGARAPGEPVFRAGPLRSTMGREAYLARVARILEYLHAGDAYQVNLTHRLCGGFSGSARVAFLTLVRGARPWHGAYLEFDHAGTRRAILSASPELFLEFDPGSRALATRPMKGTRALGDAVALLRSEKDDAELAMIVDLMRNDLSRVSRVGSVLVEDARRVESHTHVAQTTATVRALVREGLGPREILRALFPGGSVTGAPKLRARQIIRELEDAPRGPYCGSVGFFGDDGALRLNLAIRTATIAGPAGDGALDDFARARLDYGVGGGIVVGSDPDGEWRETLLKAAPVRAIATIEAGA